MDVGQDDRLCDVGPALLDGRQTNLAVNLGLYPVGSALAQDSSDVPLGNTKILCDGSLTGPRTLFRKDYRLNIANSTAAFLRHVALRGMETSRGLNVLPDASR